MIDRKSLLTDLQDLLPELEADLRDRVRDVPELDSLLRGEHQAAREAGRTAQAYEEWREEPLTQAAVAWTLGCVFVRFMEDNGLVEKPRLSGPGERLKLARDHHTVFFQKHPSETDREYLLDVFRDVATLPAARELFDERHNPIWALGLSGDGAQKLLQLWQQIDPKTGTLVHDFTDPDWNTRFLGDLYQDLSEAARKTYALLQTPEFVEEFILDRTLGPATEEFGYKEVRLIDPTCGSGHFLLGAFRRLFELWLRHEPGTNIREVTQRALDGVYGVDLNPFAIAIARFRLLTAALQACGVTRLKDAPGFRINVAVGDSLLHGPRFAAIAGVQASLNPEEDPLRHVYATEDRDALKRVFGQRYHAVVGNPPYITVKDKALNAAYRQKYGSCHMKYSLVVPFMERLFELCLPGPEAAGFVGMIAANSFMKREFGTKLIEDFIPRWDLTHVLDTSGAYIPGHGTPTVVLFGRNRQALGGSIRTVMGIRGEPLTPEDPARGLVWSAIVKQVDQPDSLSEWVSVADTPRTNFHRHPWNIGGGGAAELKDALQEGAARRLGELTAAIGITAVTGDDDLYMLGDRATARRLGVEQVRPLVVGDLIRDWTMAEPEPALWLYGEDFAVSDLMTMSCTRKLMWPLRAVLSRRKRFGTPMLERGLTWYEWQELYVDKLQTPQSIAFAFVATHNHFVLDRGGKVFKQSAPVIKLPESTTEEEHLQLVGLLNSSTACFWMKQVFYPKASVSGDVSIEKGKPEANRYEIAGTGLLDFPLVSAEHLGVIGGIAHQVDELAREITGLEPSRLIPQRLAGGGELDQRQLEAAEAASRKIRGRMVALQEELDWACYSAYELTSLGADSVVLTDDDARIEPEERPFAWAGDDPPRLPSVLERTYRERRAESLRNSNLRLIETPVYKRLWLGRQGVFGHETSTYRDRIGTALRLWLLDRLESGPFWLTAEATSCARLADLAHVDDLFMRVATLYRQRADFDVVDLVTELVDPEAVPFLPGLRYRESALQKRRVWERTWDLQRKEDRGEKVGDIPVPPKYTSSDFRKSDFWRLRGKLDVPRERFISYPACERDADSSLVVGWAGWNHLQQAHAVSSYYVAMKETEGWSPERLTPLLAGLVELLPWLEQWHNEVDPAYGMGMGEYFSRFVDEEIRGLKLTVEEVRAWKPANAGKKKTKKR